MPWLAIANASAHAFVVRKNVHDDDRDDFFQIARLACWQADRDWKPGLTEHRKFLSDRAWCRMLDLFADPGYGEELGRSYYRAGHRRVSLSLDMPVSHHPLVTVGEKIADGSQPFTDGSNRRIDLDRALEQISPRAAALIQLIDREDLMQSEVVRVLGLSDSRVSQIRAKAFSRMRPLLAA